MSNTSNNEALASLLNLIDRADTKEPSGVEGISRRLASAYGRFDLLSEFHGAVRKTVSGRLATSGLRAPKVVYVVTDFGIAVLGGIEWSGFMKTEASDSDLIVGWSDVHKVVFRFPPYLGGLGIQATEHIHTETGPFEIIVAASGGRIMRIVPDNDVAAFAGAARETARMLDNSTSDASQPTPTNEPDHPLITGLLRYLDFPLPPERTALLECSAVAPDVLIPGFAVIAEDMLWFFDHHDCLVPDIADGSAYQMVIDEISSCTVIRPQDFPLPAFEHVNVLPVNARDGNLNITLRVGDDYDELELYVPDGGQRDAEGRLYLEQTVAKFLGLIDRSGGF